MSSKLLEQGYLVQRLKSSYRKFCGQDYIHDELQYIGLVTKTTHVN